MADYMPHLTTRPGYNTVLAWPGVLILRPNSSLGDTSWVYGIYEAEKYCGACLGSWKEGRRSKEKHCHWWAAGRCSNLHKFFTSTAYLNMILHPCKIHPLEISTLATGLLISSAIIFFVLGNITYAPLSNIFHPNLSRNQPPSYFTHTRKEFRI